MKTLVFTLLFLVPTLAFGVGAGEFLGSGAAVTKALYRFSGDNADSSGNGKTLIASSTVFSPGPFGQAQTFSGVASYASSTINATGLSGNAAMTISFWVRPTSVTQNTNPLIQIGNRAASREIGIWFGDGGDGNVTIQTGGGKASTTAGVVTPNAWNFVTIAYATAGLQSTTVFVNGKFLPVTGSNATANITETVASIVLGCGYNGSATPRIQDCISASVDEVVIENRTWSRSQIQKYYARMKGRYAPTVRF